MFTLVRPPSIAAERVVHRLTDEMLTEESVRGLGRLADRLGRQRLVIDLGGVRIPTAGGLGALLVLDRNLRTRGGGLTLLNVHPWAYDVFAITRLTDLLDVRVA
jgi:anti-anti-sigma regulatory factor